MKKKADIVIGSRYLGKSNYKIPLHTRVGEWVVKECLRLLYHQKVANNQSGFRAFSAESIRILHNMVYTKFGLCTETLFKAAYNNLKIVEIPITLNSRQYGTSNVKISKIFKSILSCIIIYSMARLKLKRLIHEKTLNFLRNIFIKFLRIIN